MKHRTHPASILLILFIFIWPILMVFLLTLIGSTIGCQLAGPDAGPCWVGGMNLGNTIHSLMTIAWQFPLLAWFPFFWILAALGLLILIHHEIRGWLRPLLGLLSIWFLPIAPSWLASLYVARMAPLSNCTIGIQSSPCWLFGVDMTTAFATVTLIPWLVLIVLPVSAALSISYVLLLWLVRPRRRRMV